MVIYRYIVIKLTILLINHEIKLFDFYFFKGKFAFPTSQMYLLCRGKEHVFILFLHAQDEQD